MNTSLLSSNPGFIDAHVHIRNPAAIEDIAQAGVAAVREAGTNRGTALAFHRYKDLEGLPSVMTAGRAIVRKGGYGALLGIGVETRDEIAREIMVLKSEGVAIIKVIASGIVSIKNHGRITAGGFGRDELQFITETAGRYGLPVMAHANGREAIQNALDAGVKSIEHGFFATEEQIHRMAEEGVWWVPTAGALLRVCELPDVSSEAKRFIEQTVDNHLAMIAAAFQEGVSLAVGTDAVLPDRRYRSYYEAELILFRRAGIPDDAVLNIAGNNGAKLLGLNELNKKDFQEE